MKRSVGIAAGIAAMCLGLAMPNVVQASAVIVAGEDGTRVERGEAQLPPIAGTPLQTGDVIRCLGRSNFKAIIGDTLLLFGPLTEARIVSLSPLQIALERGVVRFVTAPDRQGSVTVQTEASRMTSSNGNILIRYNATSQFTELVALDGSVTGENRIGSTGTITLEANQSSLLSPESRPTAAAPVSARDRVMYERVTTLNVAPVPGADPFATLGTVLDRLDRDYANVRGELGRASLPLHAPYRTLDTHRTSQSTRIIDRSSSSAAPGGAGLDINWTFDGGPRENP